MKPADAPAGTPRNPMLYSSEKKGRAVHPGLILLPFLVFFFNPLSAWAAGNIQLGPFKLHPFFEIGQVFDDNVCRGKDARCPDPDNPGERVDGGDTFTLIDTGVNVILPLRRHQIEGGYSGSFARYNEFKLENYSDNRVSGAFQLNFPRGFSLHGKEEWVSGHDRRGQNQNVDLDFFRQNTLDLGAGLFLGTRIRLEGEYQHYTLNYEKDSLNEFRDRSENKTGGSIFFRAFPKTYFLASFDVTDVQFDEDNPFFGVSMDSTEKRVWGGVAWELTSKTQGTLKAGYLKKDFENIDDEISGGIADGILQHALTERSEIHFFFRYDLEESNLATQTHHRETLAGLQFTHKIHARVEFDLRGGYSRQKYPEEDVFFAAVPPGEMIDREDKTWEVGTGLTYNRYDWLILGLRYNHIGRSSTFEVFDYADNQYSLSLRFEF